MTEFSVSNGMPLEIWIDKYARKKEDGSYQSWSERVHEVVDGSYSICPDSYITQCWTDKDYNLTMDLAKKGVLAFSGRHLQHGDVNQKNKLGESFTNCFSADTKVSTLEYGPIELSKINGQKVTVKARDGEWRTAVCHYHGTQTLYEYTFRAKFGKLDKGITKVVATEDHRWFLDEGFETTKLDVGHMVAPITFHDPLCEEAICHGLVFGDGSGHRRYKEDGQGEIIKQGVQYCSIRLCGSDKNYLNLFENVPGANVTYHNSGDPVVYVGRKPWKDVPHTTDPSYIAGFIYGWWLADGEKTRSDGDRVVCIGTTNTDAIDWLVKFAPYAGFVITRGASYDSDAPQRIYNIKGKTGYGKPLYWIRLERGLPLKVLSKTKVGVNGVYCLEEPVTHGFMLANGMLTGNCSTALFSWTSFWLLLKGSGVGRCYDSDIHFVDWEFMPNVRFVLSKEHPDYDLSIESLEEAQHKYDSDSDKVRWFEVEDSAEGWVKIVLVLETAAFHKNNKDNLFIFDFTKVRGRGVPIRGQQGRPSSGPVPLIQSLNQVASIKGAGWKPWKQALFIDHYLSSCVAVGGVRRSARMATKYWKDRDVIEFIDIKRGGWLYTANNSITVDKEFWDQAKDPRPSHARRVFEAAVAASYWDKTGEPGFINIDKLTWNSRGMQDITSENYLNPEYFDVFGEIHPRVYSMIDYHLRAVKKKKYPYIVNPCGEIVLAMYGGYCVIGDICLSNASTLQEVLDAGKMMAKFLVRVNKMKYLYQEEVNRTNRIGVSLTGIHEFAWKMFVFSFYDLLDEEKSISFWDFIHQLKCTVDNSAIMYSLEIGSVPPHTVTTMKPSGTISKVLDCTEAAHLPSFGYYLRWVQFRHDHPLLKNYSDRGYPVRDISKQYKDTWIVGFPTRQKLSDMMGDMIVTAGEATPEQQYRWIQLLEKYWLGDGTNNQISYTLKYDPEKVSYQDFSKILTDLQSTVRCCCVMPQEDTSAYIYTPEEKITKKEYYNLISSIDKSDRESVDEETLMCEVGACPIEHNINAAAGE